VDVHWPAGTFPDGTQTAGDARVFTNAKSDTADPTNSEIIDFTCDTIQWQAMQQNARRISLYYYSLYQWQHPNIILTCRDVTLTTPLLLALKPNENDCVNLTFSPLAWFVAYGIYASIEGADINYRSGKWTVKLKIFQYVTAPA
jgi:hypothetical protein